MIQIVIEGHGEVSAAPILVQRLVYELGVGKEMVKRRAYRCPKGRMTGRREEFGVQFNRVRSDPEASAVLFLFDADEKCARDYVPQMKLWAVEDDADIPCGIVMATCEYEAWFLAALESLAGTKYPGNPEGKRDAKGALKQFIPTYSQAADQASLSSRMDLGQAYRNAPTFRKLVDRICEILRQIGEEPTIPDTWIEEPEVTPTIPSKKSKKKKQP